jgi:hypothetical protein
MFLAVRVSDFMVRVMLPGYPGEEDFRVDLSVLWEWDASTKNYWLFYQYLFKNEKMPTCK